jgi:predicted amidohydrolase
MSGTFKLALLQMHVEAGDRTHNIIHAEELITQAAGHGADMSLLPEAMDLGWTHPACLQQAEPIPDGKACRRLCELAREHGMYICTGLVEKAGEEIFNSAVMIDRGGNLVLLHRKINELEIGHPYYSQGDRLGICHTELGTFGLMICADGFAHDRVLSRALGYMGADIIFSPCAWAVPPDNDNLKNPYGKTWRDAYIPVAREFSLWVIGVSNVGPITAGPWKGWDCIGSSLVIGSDGTEVVQGPYGVDAETILYIDVSTTSRPARGTGWEKHWQAVKAEATK